jgi:hypothetical protein
MILLARRLYCERLDFRQSVAGVCQPSAALDITTTSIITTVRQSSQAAPSRDRICE